MYFNTRSKTATSQPCQVSLSKIDTKYSRVSQRANKTMLIHWTLLANEKLQPFSRPGSETTVIIQSALAMTLVLFWVCTLRALSIDVGIDDTADPSDLMGVRGLDYSNSSADMLSIPRRLSQGPAVWNVSVPRPHTLAWTTQLYLHHENQVSYKQRRFHIPTELRNWQ